MSSTSPTDPADIPDPEQWATKDDPATEAQLNLIGTLAKQASVDPPNTENMTKAQASETIEQLRAQNGLPENSGQTNAPNKTQEAS